MKRDLEETSSLLPALSLFLQGSGTSGQLKLEEARGIAVAAGVP